MLLLISGPLMFWLKFGWIAPSPWFWGKMAFLVLMLIFVVWAGINSKAIQKGDQAAAKRAPMLGIGAALSFILVMGCAALTFQGT